jgi:hypothetical protein
MLPVVGRWDRKGRGRLVVRMSKGARSVVSEYQSYEFMALDRPLTPAEIAELRSISTRAQISGKIRRVELREREQATAAD